jgi:hypothetical protein
MWNNHQVNSNYGQSERNRTLAKERENRKNFRLGILMVITPFLIFVILAVFMPKKAFAADNSVIIDQVGSYNTVNISQDGSAHYAKVVLGAVSAVDNTTVSIDQKDSGPKFTSIRIDSGINNGVNVLQQGSGSHSAIMNLTGSGNSVTLDQSGSGNHTFNVVAGTGTINNGNTINASQNGGAGADKWFQVNLSGATGATVNVQQTNPTQANQGSMNIQCTSGCGTWSYTRN